MTLLAALPHGADARSVEILARIRSVFADKGFDGASMQDLARAAGMSVGNFYRYFPSKDAIVEAMVAFDMDEIQRDFAAIRQAGEPMTVLRAKIAEHVRDQCHPDDGRLWAEISAAAQRKAEIARICCGMEDLVAENLLDVFARATGQGVEVCRQRFGAHAQYIVLMIKAAATRNPTARSPDLDALILRGIDATLDEIIARSES
ncbi:TetR/AcrR family transcriptional regulator [Rhodobacter sp. Har01]|uniref:TetR/AcrR family transcriptional regulator n=1 Tax=Rhodobacter sp. Har01 TaxID=2883999 RepID=UPI001D0966E0|nr:TetR/AcrR family transcriptional regulator [Rhodobacter sp. Har01]MCB6177098.1 TetR/AcrR family transcriptional regulator [Rhodobacter sp. Har01]